MQSPKIGDVANGRRPFLVRVTSRINAIGILRACEKAFLLLVAMMTVVAATIEVANILQNGAITLADLLLMFLYTEVIGMVTVYYSSHQTPVIYPIFIAMTAVARLLVLQSKDMEPEKILYEAAAIVLLAIGAAVLRFASLGGMQKDH
jgi:protein PsiE